MESYRAWLIHLLPGLSCAVDTSQVQFGLMNTFPVILKSDKRKLVHVRTGKQENKARRKDGKEEWKKRTSADVILAALARRDHTGSRAIWWPTEIDRRTHTCMIDASIYVVAVSWISHARQRKSAGSVTNMFWNTHERPAHLISLIFGRKQEGSTVRVEQVQVVDQTTLPPKCHSFVGLDRQNRLQPPCCLIQSLTHTHGLHGVFTLQARVPLENKALKGRVEKGEPGCFKKAKQHRELA